MITEAPISSEYLDQIEREMSRPLGTHVYLHTHDYFNEETEEFEELSLIHI